MAAPFGKMHSDKDFGFDIKKPWTSQIALVTTLDSVRDSIEARMSTAFVTGEGVLRRKVTQGALAIDIMGNSTGVSAMGVTGDALLKLGIE